MWTSTKLFAVRARSYHAAPHVEAGVLLVLANRATVEVWRAVTLFAGAAALMAMVCGIGATAEEIGPPALTKSDLSASLGALKAAKRGRWASAHAFAERVPHPLPAKIVRWLYYTKPGANVSFADIAEFVADGNEWPRQEALLTTAERAAISLPASELIAWFREHPPRTGLGKAAFAVALEQGGFHEEGAEALRDAWINGDFSRSEERRFYRRHKKELRREDHETRLDRLLWDERIGPARRMLPRVSDAYRGLGEARLYLMLSHPGVDEAIARLSDELREHAGLVYERVRWRRRKGFDDRARELLFDPPSDLIRPDKWWVERQRQVRESLNNGSISEAYSLAADHGQIDAAPLSEAEWLAGWIALRFLGDRAAAFRHFERMYEAVQYPVSRARGAYWAASAAAAMGDRITARVWYAKAVVYPTTFYGQLARLAVYGSSELDLPDDPEPTDQDVAAFSQREVVQAILLLDQLGQKDLVRPFVLRLADTVDSPGEHALAAGLAHGMGRPDLAVAAAKRSARRGVYVISRAYPRPALPDDIDAETALVLAVARQESEFNTSAVSPAGARGLMQLMPATARYEAKRLRVGYSETRLLGDAHYNLRLGGSYLSKLVDAYQGSYVMALAAYNAGGSRIHKWMRNWGDPRLGEIGMVDWIELIPIAETRNFVQRVLENLQVYRHTLAGGRLQLIGDLYRRRVHAAQ